MQSQQAVREGFKRRPQSRERKKRESVPHGKWCSTPDGIVLKILIGLIGDCFAQRDIVVTRSFRKSGVNPERLYTLLLIWAPWAPDWYREHTGRELTPNIVGQRFHKMYHETSKGVGKAKLSQEHYKHCPKLRPHLPVVEELFLQKNLISREEAIRAATSI